MAVEVDGPIHQYNKQQDLARQLYLADTGIKMLRFSNDEVLTEMDRVLEIISQEMAGNSDWI